MTANEMNILLPVLELPRGARCAGLLEVLRDRMPTEPEEGWLL